jgi:hypothetical protein
MLHNYTSDTVKLPEDGQSVINTFNINSYIVINRCIDCNFIFI